MITTYRLNTAELNQDFLESIKHLFQNSDIEIFVKKASDSKKEVFKYSDKLIQSVENIERRKNLKTYTIEEFENMSKQLVSK